MEADFEIMKMSLQEAWEMFSHMTGEGETYNRARFGNEAYFDINDYIKGRYMIKGKKGKIRVGCKWYKLTEFETEIEKRKRQIKQYIIDNYGDDELISPRNKQI